MISTPGLYDIDARRYHADPCPAPSLSSSLARLMLERTPRHAWVAHPRLNPDFDAGDDKPTRAMEVGTAVHKLVLARGADLAVIEGDNYLRKAAQEARAAAYAAGKAAILEADYGRAQAAAVSAWAQMGNDVTDDLSLGLSEVTLAWQEGAVWCRAMVDKLFVAINSSGATIYDVKTTSTGAAPGTLGWKVADMGYEVQAAFYERGLAQVRPALAGRITFRHIWIETDPPYGTTVTELDAAAITIGRKKAAAAIGLWQRCMAAGVAAEHWPLYPAGIHRVEYPPRAEAQWLEREMSDDEIADIVTRDPFLVDPRIAPPPRQRTIAEPC